MYEQYLENPDSVNPSWKKYFDNLQEGVPYNESEFNKPTAAASSVKRTFVAVSWNMTVCEDTLCCYCVTRPSWLAVS